VVHVRFDERYLRPTEVDALIGDASRAKEKLGWVPKVDTEQLARIMVDADIEALYAGDKSKLTVDEQRRAREVGRDAGDDVVHVGRPAAHEDGRPGRWRERAVGGTQVGHQPAGLGSVRTVRRIDRDCGEVARRRGVQLRPQEPVGRSRDPGVQEPVLVELETGVDVDQALHPGHPGIRGQPARVVVEGGQVRVVGHVALHPDRQDDRREGALPEGGDESVVGGTRRDGGREDRSIRGVEADMEERRAEEQQDREGRDEHLEGPPHDGPGEARPATVGI